MIEYYKGVIETIEDAIESIQIEVYEQVISESVDVLKAGGKIIASGLGKNVPICEKFVGTLNSLGVDARFLHTTVTLVWWVRMISCICYLKAGIHMRR